jgi:hypothetical protein
MAFPTAVNSQITDAVTQANVHVVGEAPAQALGALYQAIAHAAGLAAQNAVAQQQNANQVAIAVTTKCVNALLSTPNAGT